MLTDDMAREQLNDGSRMIMGEIESQQSQNTFRFGAQSKDLVTLVVVPEYSLDRIGIRLKDQQGQVLAESKETGMINFVQFYTDRNMSYHIEIFLIHSNQIFAKKYRLIATTAQVDWKANGLRGGYACRHIL